MATTRKLRDLSRPWITATEEFASAATEVKESPDRSACIVVTSLITQVLERVILARLLIDEESRISPLFGRDDALSTFYGNIHLAFALQLISEAVRDDLEVIRRVRNAFAHSVLPLTFDTKDISLEIFKLRYNNYYTLSSSEREEFESFSPTDRREFMICCHAVGNILIRAILSWQSNHLLNVDRGRERHSSLQL